MFCQGEVEHWHMTWSTTATKSETEGVGQRSGCDISSQSRRLPCRIRMTTWQRRIDTCIMKEKGRLKNHGWLQPELESCIRLLALDVPCRCFAWNLLPTASKQNLHLFLQHNPSTWQDIGMNKGDQPGNLVASSNP